MWLRAREIAAFAEALVVVCIALAAFAFLYPLNAQDPSRLALTQSLALRASISIDPYATETGDRARHDGHWYSDKAPGISFLAVPPLRGAIDAARITGGFLRTSGTVGYGTGGRCSSGQGLRPVGSSTSSGVLSDLARGGPCFGLARVPRRQFRARDARLPVRGYRLRPSRRRHSRVRGVARGLATPQAARVLGARGTARRIRRVRRVPGGDRAAIVLGYVAVHTRRPLAVLLFLAGALLRPSRSARTTGPRSVRRSSSPTATSTYRRKRKASSASRRQRGLASTPCSFASTASSDSSRFSCSRQSALYSCGAAASGRKPPSAGPSRSRLP